MITVEEKREIVGKFGKDAKDSGSPEVQVAILTKRISDLSGHFGKHIHDHHSKLGLMKMIGRRRRLLKYVRRQSEDRYLKLIKELGLRK